jgi:uncharacterized protein (TIGR03067 family)
MNPVLLALALTVAAPGPKDPPKKEADLLLGKWVGVKSELGGQPEPQPAGGVIVEFTTDGKMVSQEGANAPEESGYTTDPKKDPAEIDITVPAFDKKVIRMVGIFKVEGDTLTMCLVVDRKRPTKFETAAGELTALLTFKRAKKD